MRRRLDLTPQALTLLLAVVLLHGVWQSSGARVAITAEVAIVVVLLVDLAWSAAATRHIRLAVVDVPHDAVVGEPVQAELDVAGARVPIELRMLSAARARWHAVIPPARGVLAAAPVQRGTMTAAVLEVRSRAPLGLVGISGREVVALPHPLTVAPRREVVPSARLPQRGAVPAPDEIVRGTRPWAPGDPLRSVHWPSVARTNELLVKELEPPPAPRIVIAVELGVPGPEGESAASRGAWVADEALRRGCRVTLATIEGDAVVVADVRGPLEVGRRLAAATAGQRFTTAPDPRSIVWIRAEGDTFPSLASSDEVPAR